MTVDPTRTRQGNYDITWHSYTAGGVDEVDPTGLVIMMEDITVGSMGKVVLGKRIVGLDGTIKAQLREVDGAAFQALMPWYSSGSIALSPATQNVDLYTYAQKLVLHPTDVEDTSEDLTLLKAVPIIRPMKRDGVNTKEYLGVEFILFPDRDQFPTLVWGYVGPEPG